MSSLSSFRASIKKLIDAPDLSEALRAEGMDSRMENLLLNSKGIRASRSVDQRDKTDLDK